MRPSLGDEIGGRGLEQMRGGVEHLLAQGSRTQAARRRPPARCCGSHRCRCRPAPRRCRPARRGRPRRGTPRCSAITCASVVSSPWPCDAMPNAAVTAPVESMRMVDGLGAGVDRHAGRDRDARADAGQLGVARDADAEPFAGRARFGLLAAQRRRSRSSRTRPRGLRRSRTCPTRCRSRSCSGNSSGGTRLRRRISFGSRPSCAAAMSIRRSITKVEIGRPTPR